MKPSSDMKFSSTQAAGAMAASLQQYYPSEPIAALTASSLLLTDFPILITMKLFKAVKINTLKFASPG